MRITETQLRRIIRQEILRENPDVDDKKVPTSSAKAQAMIDKNTSLSAVIGQQDTVGELDQFIRGILAKADDAAKGGVSSAEVLTTLRNILSDKDFIAKFNEKPTQKESRIRRASRKV